MEASGVMSIVAVVSALVGVVAIIVGVLLIVTAVRKKKDGKISVAKVVIGIFSMLFAICLFFVAMIFGILKLTVGDEMSSEEVTTFNSNIEKALESNDPDELSDLFAKKSIKGDPLTNHDAEQMFESLGSDVKDVKIRTNSFHVTNGDSFAGVVIKPEEKSDGDYLIEVEYTYKYWNEDCVGIQYIKVKRDGKMVYEAGTFPYEGD